MQRGANYVQKKGASQNVIDDVYWKGICYIEKCKAEKEMKEFYEKDKIKNEIQQRKLKTAGASSSGLPPGGGAKRGRGVGL